MLASDSAPIIELNASFDFLEIENSDISFSESFEDFSLRELQNFTFSQGESWNDVQPDFNDYRAIIRIVLHNTSKFELDWWLNLPGNRISAFVLSSGLGIDSFYTGNLIKRNDRPVPSHFKINSFVPLTIPAGDTITVIARIEQSKFYPLNRRVIHVARPNVAELSANEFSNNYRYSLGFYTAAILMLGIYCLIYFLFSRERYALLLSLVCILYSLLFQGYHSGFYRWNIDQTWLLYGAFVLANILVSLDMFFLSSFVQKEIELSRWSWLFHRLGLVTACLAILSPVIYYLSQDFFLILFIIGIVHGAINLIRLFFGSYLIRVGLKLHVFIGLTLVLAMIVNFTASYYMAVSDFISYDLLKLGSSVYALGFVISLSYISVKSRKDQVIAESERLASEARVLELERLDQMKNRLFTNIAHEFRTPLALISGPISSILQKKVLRSDDSRLLNISKRNAADLIQKINTILELSKLENNPIENSPSQVNLYSYFEHWLDEYDEVAKENGVQIFLQYFGNQKRDVNIDRVKLESIVKNLVSNALKAMPYGGKIEVNVTLLPQEVQIEIGDTGHGIDAEELELIFDRYYQSDTDYMKNVVGTGIGLALCKEYTEILGGNISVNSKINKGSVFSVVLPVQSVSENDIMYDEVATTVNDQDSVIDMQPLRSNGFDTTLPIVLLVEDNNDFRFYIKSILDQQFNIVESRNGEEALRYLNANISSDKKSVPVDLIITDLMMPVSDGFTLINQVKKDDGLKDIPIIITSAKSDLESRNKAIRFGVDDYLVKPFDDIELITQMNVLIDRSVSRTRSNEDHDIEDSSHHLDNNESGLINELRRIVEDNISDFDFTLEDIAAKIFVSRRQLHRKVKARTGLTPNQLIQEIRLERARSLLMGQQCKSVKEVAFNVGFKKPAYFSKLFFKRYGKMPSSYFNNS